MYTDRGWRDRTVGKTLAMYTSWPLFDSQKPRESPESHQKWCLSALPGVSLSTAGCTIKSNDWLVWKVTLLFPFCHRFARGQRFGCVQNSALPIIHRHGQGRHCCWSVMDVNTSLQEVLKTVLIHDGLACGIRGAAKVLDKHQAHLCVFASNCEEPMYAKWWIHKLCAEH